MTFPSPLERGRGTKYLGVVAVASLLSLPVTTVAQAQAPTTGKSAEAGQPTAAELEEWRKALRVAPRPNGCFAANYPEKTWREVPCKPPTPTKLYSPRQTGTTRIDQVGGNGTDLVATVTGNISQVTGSFPAPNVTATTNNYSLQLNTNYFSSPTACTGSMPVPANTGLNVCAGCCAWQQFIYNGGGNGFIQYWLINYGPVGTLCPTPRHANCAAGSSYSDGWCPVPLGSLGSAPAVQCVINMQTFPPVNSAPLNQLGTLTLGGATAASGLSGANDSISFSVGGVATGGPGNNYFPELSTNWTAAEFNVFGNGNSAQLSFNPGSTVTVQIAVTSGSQAGPGCVVTSYTGESNNLTLVNSPPMPMPSPGPSPELVFAQTYTVPGGPVASCADAASIGDTHLTTFNGLLYDFQATGDFLLAETGAEFSVQTRQASGAPTWPDAAVNKAVAVRAGRNRVAICLPGKVVVDGKSVKIRPSHGLLRLSDGGAVLREGDVYYVLAPTGDSIRAALSSSHIDVSVGLGRWPSKVRGLLANVNGNVNEIEDSKGNVLTTPLSFKTLYGQFTDSWLVRSKESILSFCGPSDAHGIPEKPFFANNLSPELAKANRAICEQAGVKDGPLLDACMIDVAMLGRGAAQVFARMRRPVAVGDAR